MESKIAVDASIRELLNEAEALLNGSGIEEARRTCEILAEEAFSCSRAGLYSNDVQPAKDRINYY